MLKYLVIFFCIGIPCAAAAEDARMPELLHLLATSVACKIDPNPEALRFMNNLQGRLDEATTKAAYEQVQADVEAEIATKGPVTVCWDAWDKMRSNGFIQPFYPVLPTPASKP